MFDIKKPSKKQIYSVAGSVLYKVFRFVFLLGISYIMLYSVLKLISEAFAVQSDYDMQIYEWIPEKLTFTNFQLALHNFPYLEKLKITIFISGVSTIIQLLICSFAGYGLAKFPFKGNGIVFGMVIMVIVFPVSSYYIPLYLEYRFFNFFGIGELLGLFLGKPLTANLLNTYWVYFLPALFGMGLSSGLFIFIFRQFFKGIPKELEEAARVDGCNALSTYFRIVIPNAVPVFVTVALLSMIFYWNDNSIGDLFMSNLEKSPIISFIGNFKFISWSDIGSEMQMKAALLMAIAPMIILFIIGQKFFIECLDRSGIKG